MSGKDEVRTSRRIGVVVTGIGELDSCIRVYDIDTDEDLTSRCAWVSWEPRIIKAKILDVDREGVFYRLEGDDFASYDVYEVLAMAAMWRKTRELITVTSPEKEIKDE